MEYVIFRPYWSPPPSIIRSEIVPKARRDPSYLDRQNMEIVASGDENAPALPATPANLNKVVAGRLFVRQKPGEKNSLGLAKFIFPNSENVYMHGTPAQSLSPAPAATSATAAFGSKTRPASPSGSCATPRSGRGRGSTPRCGAPGRPRST